MKNENNSLLQILSINKTIHEPVRLLIMSILYNTEEVDFVFLLNETKLTKGNIATHIRRLEDDGYLKIKKEFIGKKPHSTYTITEKGRTEFKNYVEFMKKILKMIDD
jgi:DNA-binding PadR family transcriptional regulator